MHSSETESKSSNRRSEFRLKGRPVSRGRAFGKIVCIYGSGRQFFRTQLDSGDVGKEIQRFREAVALSGRRLERIGDGAIYLSESTSSIMGFQRAILEDVSFIEKIETAIAIQVINAEWAVKIVADDYASKYKSIPDEHFRDRYIDVEDVAEQIQSALGGGSEGIQLSKDSIIAASVIKPSTVAELAAQRPAAIITENGGWTSHAFILARELEIPAVTGVRKLLRRISTDDSALVDANEGLITINPDAASITKFSSAGIGKQKKESENIEPGASTRTLDGKEIIIRANFDLAENYQSAASLGAKGIGLFRSEYLFNRYKGFPDEAEQVRAYREIAEFAGADRARIRLFDLSVHQISEHPNRKEPNPALGLRGIRLGLSLTRQLKTQISAILRASRERHIDIVVPMVSGTEEINQVRELIEFESKRLTQEGVAVGTPGIAAMVELPSAVLGIDPILEIVDSVCIGTNDLVQYLLAVDRDNESVAEWFRSLHPSVINALRMVIEAAGNAGKPAVVCGEMAGSPFYVPILIGLGATELSMNINSIGRVRGIVTGIAAEEAHKLVKIIHTCTTAAMVETAVEDFIAANWTHLFPKELLVNRRS